MSSNRDQSFRHPSCILGIWRTGEVLYRRDEVCLLAAQPADREGSPRYDYVLKTIDSSQDHHGGNAGNAKRGLQRFIQAACVSHPNLVAVLDASDAMGLPYLVMPRLRAISMDARVASMTQFQLPIALWWARQVAQGLEAFHAAGWVHANVCPQNLLVDDKGHVTLIDLGNASRTHTPLSPVFRGAEGFAAPELVRGDTAALPPMDIFALGQVLWSHLVLANLADNQVVGAVAELIEAMLAPEPQQRPTATEVIKRLLSLEIESLGGHIGIGQQDLKRRAA